MVVSEAMEIAEGFNQHFRVRTSLGDKHLIIFRSQAGKPPREFQFAIRQYAVEQGFDRLARPVPSEMGSSFVKTPLGTVALVDWIPGQDGSTHGEWSVPLVREAAATLADLHLATRGFHPVRQRPERLSQLYLPADMWVAAGDDLLQGLPERCAKCGIKRANIAQRLDETRQLFDADAYDEALTVGTRVVHGDYRPANLIVDDGRIVGVVDLDASFWESRVYDLAYGAFQFGAAQTIYPQRRRDLAFEFVEWYTRRWPLATAERQLFPFFLRHVVVKRLLAGRDPDPRLALLDQLDAGLEAELLRAVA